MNRGNKLKQLRRFILKHGKIIREYWREPDPDFPPYRKGSYFLHVQTDEGNYVIGDSNKYKAYKWAVADIKKYG